MFPYTLFKTLLWRIEFCLQLERGLSLQLTNLGFVIKPAVFHSEMVVGPHILQDPNYFMMLFGKVSNQ